MKNAVADLYRGLSAAYGPQAWWPAGDPFEMMVGAILTQHTAWTNAAKAIASLRAAGRLSPHRLGSLSEARLKNLIRPAGMVNVKQKRLKSYVDWYLASGGFDALCKKTTGELRKALLNVHGIGPETADDILVYAFNRPVFVVDAYARRILGRYGLSNGGESYEQFRARVESAMPRRARHLGELHALLVTHAKSRCRVKPDCGMCCVRAGCAQKMTAGR